MGIQPNIVKKAPSFITKKCSACGGDCTPDQFSPLKSIFFADGIYPVCNSCVKKSLFSGPDSTADWYTLDKLCQLGDIPFLVQEWEKLYQVSKENTFPVYAKLFASEEYAGIDWKMYNDQYLTLQKAGLIENELPLINDKKKKELMSAWGANYSYDELMYLEDLYQGVLRTQNVNGRLQIDQAQKICKISLEIDSRIRAGADFDKLLTSYDKLVKTAEFTPKSAKNQADFDSTGELYRWLERRGWRNEFYDDVTRDIVDETIKNHQSYGQKLYTNETGIGEEINRRIEALRNTAKVEDFYDTNTEFDLDEFQNSAYDVLLEEDGEFRED